MIIFELAKVWCTPYTEIMKNIIDYLRPHDYERFHTCYSRGADQECWIWQRASRYKNGIKTYGCFNLGQHGKRQLKAHRVAYFLARGPFDWNLHVLHQCDNPRCVNPAHLFLGTNLDNIRDRISKGRYRRRTASKPIWKYSLSYKTELRKRTTPPIFGGDGGLHPEKLTTTREPRI